MQSEIAPPEDDDRLAEPDTLVVVLAHLNRALATCIEEIEALQRRVESLERSG